MKKKMIITIGGSIVLGSIAATYFALELSSDSKPLDPPLMRVIPKEAGVPAPKVNKIEPTVAYAIYRYENEFLYIDSTINPPDSIQIVGELEVVEAKLIDSTNVTHRVCDVEYDRPLKKYEMKKDFRMTPYVAIPMNAKVELIEGEFIEKPLPKELVSWVFDNFEEIQNESDLIGCTYKALGEDLEIVNCKEDELLLFNRNPIGSIQVKHVPIAFVIMNNKKYLMSKYVDGGSVKIDIRTGQNDSEVISVLEGNYPEYCEPPEEEAGD